MTKVFKFIENKFTHSKYKDKLHEFTAKEFIQSELINWLQNIFLLTKTEDYEKDAEIHC